MLSVVPGTPARVSLRRICCASCGVAVDIRVRTKPAVKCAACVRAHKFLYDRQYEQQKRDARPAKVCISCRSEFVATRKGARCTACSATHKRSYQLRFSEKRRRALGAVETKGTTATCARCSSVFVRNGIKAKYCDGCKRLALNEWAKAYKDNDPGRRLSANMSCAINNSLKYNGSKRRRRWEALVGYTLGRLRQHLERQFLQGMSWGNRDLWEIDHIVPLASFTFGCPEDDEFKAAWALTNLRPLWRGDNRRKKDRRLYLC